MLFRSDRAEVDLGGSKKLTIEAKRKSPEDKYIQEVTFAGQPYSKTWFRHADIGNGGNIVFTLGSEPNRQFGAEESAAPPSLSS